MVYMLGQSLMQTYKLNRQPYTLIGADIRLTQIEKVNVKRRFNSVKYTFQVFLLTLICYFDYTVMCFKCNRIY